ncbi:MAG: tetratricopeptide repeat protein, partial [Bryobacteraceae bacterium]
MLDAKPPPAEGDAVAGIRLMEAGKAKESLAYLFRWRAAEPDNTDAYYYLGEALTDVKVETILQLKSANPESYRLHQILAEQYASVHKRAEAIEQYRKVLEMQPGLPGIRYELAKLISDTEIEQAIPLLAQELEIDPHHYLAKSLLGRIYVALHQPAKAIPLLREAVAASGNLTEARKALGQALAATKEFEEALDQYRLVLDVNPSEEQIHYLMAEALQSLGRHEEAAKERALHVEALRQLRKQSR